MNKNQSKMIKSNTTWILFAIQSIWIESVSLGKKDRSSLEIVKSLLAARSYDLGLNTTSVPSSGRIRAARGYFNHPHFESQLELDLAEVQSELIATSGAQRFLRKACEYGLPSYDNLFFRGNYVLSYDNRLKQPVWSLEHLTNEKANTRADIGHKQHWFADPQIHEYFRTMSDDYKNSGYERGHFSSVCDNRATQRFIEECYLVSNIAPRVSNLNHNVCVWSRLEKYILFVARRSRKTFVVTGSLFLPKNGLLFWQGPQDPELARHRVISQKRIAVPTHFYKVFVAESFDKKFTLEAYLIPNSNAVWMAEGVERFRIDIDKELPQIERLTGLRFFEILNRLRVEKPQRLQYDFKDALPHKYKGKSRSDDC